MSYCAWIMKREFKPMKRSLKSGWPSHVRNKQMHAAGEGTMLLLASLASPRAWTLPWLEPEVVSFSLPLGAAAPLWADVLMFSVWGRHQVNLPQLPLPTPGWALDVSSIKKDWETHVTFFFFGAEPFGCVLVLLVVFRLAAATLCLITICPREPIAAWDGSKSSSPRSRPISSRDV